MERDEFERLVAKAIKALPGEFLARLENIDIVVEDAPTRSQLREQGLARGETLLGLYEGVPLTERGAHYGLVPPDKITIFQEPIEESCDSAVQIIDEVASVVRHEIAHHFGLSDARLDELENRRHPG
ncbi:MAG: metallopeptidase family protein [Dehalococcoidia bacterium]|jgi:predicted Zn-dependent protease with MMP-like domain|nr:MAG: metallopeptidase family protein [Dehalococcoidia bacterium]